MTYRKDALFRTIYATGAFGGLTPDAQINMGLFTEYKDFPETTTADIIRRTDEGAELKEDTSKRTGNQMWVREIQVNVVLSRATAVALRTWLDDKINQLDKLTERKGLPQADGEESEQSS